MNREEFLRAKERLRERERLTEISGNVRAQLAHGFDVRRENGLAAWERRKNGIGLAAGEHMPVVMMQEIFNDILRIALLYETKEDREWAERAASLLEQMMPYYGEGVYPYENWWQFDIGIPHRLFETLILLEEHIPAEIREHYLRAYHFYVPVPKEGKNFLSKESKMIMTGANLTDTAYACVMRGILEENEEELKLASEAVQGFLPFVTADDGFYRDGSFIQHHFIPYAGGYGPDLLRSLENTIFLLHGSEFGLEKSPEFQNIYFWIEKSYLPFICNGTMMDMVRGRKVSRAFDGSEKTAIEVLALSLSLMEYGGELRLTEEMKGHLSRYPRLAENAEKYCTLYQQSLIWKLMADADIRPARQREYCHVYGSMDRVVKHTEKFSVGISMFSERTGRFSYGNGENKKGLHMHEGALYLYNSDAAQFTDSYWPTVDADRVPGITTDCTGTSLIPWMDNRNKVSMAGGSCLMETYAAAGMEIGSDPEFSRLTGKKAWFLFDREIVCLGADISNDRETETILENRRVGENAVLKTRETDSGLWYTLEDGRGGRTAYFLPGGVRDGQRVESACTDREGNWKEWNDTCEDTPLHGRFQLISLHHAADAQGEISHDTYSYVLFPEPEMDVEQTAEKLTVLVNNEKVQAAEKGGQVYGYLFWEPSEAPFVSARTPCSVTLWKQETGELWLAAADISQKQDEIVILLEGLHQMKEDLTGRWTLHQETGQNRTVLRANVKGLAGASLELKL